MHTLRAAKGWKVERSSDINNAARERLNTSQFAEHTDRSNALT